MNAVINFFSTMKTDVECCFKKSYSSPKEQEARILSVAARTIGLTCIGTGIALTLIAAVVLTSSPLACLVFLVSAVSLVLIAYEFVVTGNNCHKIAEIRKPFTGGVGDCINLFYQKVKNSTGIAYDSAKSGSLTRSSYFKGTLIFGPVYTLFEKNVAV